MFENPKLKVLKLQILSDFFITSLYYIHLSRKQTSAVSKNANKPATILYRAILCFLCTLIGTLLGSSRLHMHHANNIFRGGGTDIYEGWMPTFKKNYK